MKLSSEYETEQLEKTKIKKTVLSARRIKRSDGLLKKLLNNFFCFFVKEMSFIKIETQINHFSWFVKIASIYF